MPEDTLILEMPEQLKSEYQTGAISEDEYIEQIVWQIGHTSDVKGFLKCVYTNYYDEDMHVSPVSAFTDAQLEEAFEQLEEDCSMRDDNVVAQYISLLKEMLTNPQAGLMVRWALAKLVGMAVVRLS